MYVHTKLKEEVRTNNEHIKDYGNKFTECVTRTDDDVWTFFV